MVVPANEAQMDPQGLKRVEDLFREQIEQGLHPGAALSVYRFGRLVLDLYGGVADDESGKPVDRDTLFILYSCTKALSSACLHLLWERGLLDWDHPVARYWAGFARNGKARVTIRHILMHRAGMPNLPPEAMDLDLLAHPERVVEVLCDVELRSQPGRRP
ncbi:MAG: serine hydrolase domain-containing protein [Dehalococcoidia bacterium]